MKTKQKTPASVTTGGHREQGLENLYTSRTAACTGETRSRDQNLNLLNQLNGPGTQPVALSRDSFKPPLSYEYETASRHFYMDIDLGVAHGGLLTNEIVQPGTTHIHVRRAYPFPTNYLCVLVRICRFLIVRQQLSPKQICCYRTSPIFLIMVPFANYRTIVLCMSKHLFLTGSETNV